MNPNWTPGVVVVPDHIRHPKGLLSGKIPWSPATREGLPVVTQDTLPEAKVPKVDDQTTLVTLIRGAKTRSAILAAGALAKQLATTHVVWDSDVKANPGALRIEEYGTEHATEKGILAQALQTFPAPMQKCAFLHFASEAVWEHGLDVEDMIGAGEIETVFTHCHHGIADTTQAMLSIQIYSEWMYTFKAPFFAVIPQGQAKCTVIDTMNQVCRFVGTCPINFPDGTPGCFGLQLTTKDTNVNGALLHRALKDILSAQAHEKKKMGGKTMALVPQSYMVLDPVLGAKKVTPALAA